MFAVDTLLFSMVCTEAQRIGNAIAPFKGSFPLRWVTLQCFAPASAQLSLCKTLARSKVAFWWPYHHQPLQLHLSLVTSARLLILLLQRELLFYFLQHVLLTIVLLLQCYHFCLPKITAAISNGCRCYWVITYLRKPYISALSGSCLFFTPLSNWLLWKMFACRKKIWNRNVTLMDILYVY